jgi:hypothetical protein
LGWDLNGLKKEGLFTGKIVDGFYHVDQFSIVDLVMFEFSFLISIYDPNAFEDFKVLRGNTLLYFHSVIDLVYIDHFVAIYEFKDLQTKRVSKSPHQL